MNQHQALSLIPSTKNMSLETTINLAQILADSGFFADSKGAAQCVVKILAGAELGFGPIASMAGIFVVKGKVTLSANLIAATIQRSKKYNFRVTRLDNTGCTITFFENGQEIGVSTFDEKDAKVAGLFGSTPTWRSFPRNMLYARALTNGARWYCPSIFAGPVYTPDELGAVVNEDGELVALPDEETEGDRAKANIKPFPKAIDVAAQQPNPEIPQAETKPTGLQSLIDSIERMHKRIVELGGEVPFDGDIASLSASEAKSLAASSASTLKPLLISRYSACLSQIEELTGTSRQTPDLNSLKPSELDRAYQDIEAELMRLQLQQGSSDAEIEE
ncbi:MAG: hypothetical protein AB1489_38035 [Acidobacteriota bacterium]